MISLSYYSEGTYTTGVYVDKTGVASELGVSPRTISRRLSKSGYWKKDVYIIPKTNVELIGVLLTSDVTIHGSSRGCPKGENRFIKQ
jgi:hypothetical protein